MNFMNRLSDSVYIKRTCPQCLQEFYPGDCDIVSTTDPGKVLEAAPTGWRQRQVSRISPKRIDRQYVLEMACRRCPNTKCGYLLPPNIELVDNLNIAIVGDTFSGKSHYMAALIHQLEQGELQRADRYARFDCLTQDVENAYKNEVIKPLFEDKQSPPPTQMAVDVNRPPLIYELILNPSPQHPSRRVNLILYDASGEDLAIKERMVTFSRYVLNANAIIFLADPTSMPAIYSVLPAFLQKRYKTGRKSSTVLSSVIQLIERYRGYDAGARLASMPIAVTLAKSDLLKNLTSVHHQFSFHTKPTYNGTINLQEMDVIDREVRQLLDDFGERPLLQATQNFSRVKFFATSATGYAPNDKGIYPKIEPCRCLDPILWILYQLDIFHVPV
jgi:GTPase SAR1 family protein